LAHLAGSVSHEIQNPLNAISLHTDILEEELDQPGGGNREQLLHSLGVVKARTGHLHALVQEYLALARLAILPRESEDFGVLLEALALEIRELLIPHGITLRLEASSNLGPVALHKSTFWQALRKIVQYAIDAMPAGGTLSMRGQQVGSQIHLDISHPGRSCSEEQMALLSNPFPTTRPEEAELGIYLVREIVVAHQGEMTVSHEPSMGTTFTIRLPLMLAGEPLAE
jgi:signal transduction histidine kinase